MFGKIDIFEYICREKTDNQLNKTKLSWHS